MRMGALQLLLTILYLLVITTAIDDCSRKEDNKAATQLTVNCRSHKILVPDTLCTQDKEEGPLSKVQNITACTEP